jgi:3-oxoacyl-[acyl-carrier protein] reductase
MQSVQFTRPAHWTSADAHASLRRMKSVALVTGGTRGIGLGIATCLARDDHDLALCGRRDESQLADTLDNLRALGADVLYTTADVGLSADRVALLDAIRDRFGRLNVLVNNAGVAPDVRADILEASEDSYDRVMNINLKGPYFLTQAVANWMIEQKQRAADYAGCVVNISSVSATVASPNRAEYCVSKAGVAMATALFATRLAEYEIPVFEVRPGIIETDMTSGVKEKYDTLIADGLLPQARWGTPEDVGKAVAMLTRGDLPYSTGQALMVDGGLTMQSL